MIIVALLCLRHCKSLYDHKDVWKSLSFIDKLLSFFKNQEVAFVVIRTIKPTSSTRKTFSTNIHDYHICVCEHDVTCKYPARMHAFTYPRETSPEQNGELSISALTDAMNNISMLGSQRQGTTAAKSGLDNRNIDSVVMELSSVYSNLLHMNESTIVKLITDLSNKHIRSTLLEFLFNEAKMRVEGARTFFTRLSDDQYDVLVRVLNESPLPRFWRYLKICADIELGQCRHLPIRPSIALSLITRIHNLPDSLFDMVQETTAPKLLMSAMQRLKGLPLELLEPIQRSIIWVIDDGPPSVSTDLIYRMPTLQMWNILAAFMRFTTDDLHAECMLGFNGTGTEQGLEEIMARLSMPDDLNTQLANIWQAKYEQIAQLPLHSFTLDVTEAFGPDRTYLGLEVAQTLPRFSSGTPRNFTVLAPTENLRDAILQVLI